MIKINLLPKEPKKYSFINNIYFISGISVLIIFASMGGVFYYEKNQIPVLEERINVLEIEFQRLQGDLTQAKKFEKQKIELLSRLDKIENIPQNTDMLAFLIDEISLILPQDIWLNNLKNNNNNLFLSGNSISSESIDKLLEKLKESKLLSNVTLKSVRENKIDSTKIVSVFEINGTLKQIKR